MMRWIVCFTLLAALFGQSRISAQVSMEAGLMLVDRTTGKSQLWQVNAGASENQGFLFPSAIGSIGQVVKVSSVSDGSSTFVWATPSASLTGLTSIVSAPGASDGAAWAEGPGIEVTANTVYRIIGEIGVYRESSGGGDKDDLKVRIGSQLGPSPYNATMDAQFSIECVDCTTSPSGLPATKAVDNGTSIQFVNNIDPDGTGVGPANTHYYRIDGVVKPSASGRVYFGFNKWTGSNTTWVVTGSYWAVIVLESP